MADPVTIFTGLSAASSVAKGVAGYRQGQSEADSLELQGLVAGTQTLQRDTISRDNIMSSLGAIRAARAANGLSSTSSNARILEEDTRKNLNRDRIIQQTDGRIKEANAYAQAARSRSAAKWSLFGGGLNAGISLFDQ